MQRGGRVDCPHADAARRRRSRRSARRTGPAAAMAPSPASRARAGTLVRRGRAPERRPRDTLRRPEDRQGRRKTAVRTSDRNRSTAARSDGKPPLHRCRDPAASRAAHRVCSPRTVHRPRRRRGVQRPCDSPRHRNSRSAPLRWPAAPAVRIPSRAVPAGPMRQRARGEQGTPAGVATGR